MNLTRVPLRTLLPYLPLPMRTSSPLWTTFHHEKCNGKLQDNFSIFKANLSKIVIITSRSMFRPVSLWSGWPRPKVHTLRDVPRAVVEADPPPLPTGILFANNEQDLACLEVRMSPMSGRTCGGKSVQCGNMNANSAQVLTSTGWFHAAGGLT